MTGKVFDESANVYQDQAKILFDYYKAAAEKIVAEEVALEQNMDDLQAQMKQADEKRQSAEKNKPIYIGAAAACAVAAVALFIFAGFLGVIGIAGAGFFAYKFFSNSKEIDSQTNIINDRQQQFNEMNEKYKNIRRDYAVDRIGVAYVPVATRVPFENKSFLIDHTNAVGSTDFHLTLLHQPEEFQDSIQNLQESMKSVPVVESNDDPEEINTSEYSLSVQNITLHDYVGNIDRQVRNISYLLNDSEQVSVEIPAIMPDSQEADFLKNYATTETGGKPVLPVFETKFEDKISRFTQLNASQDQFQSEDTDSTDYLKDMMTKLADSVQLLSLTKTGGSSNLANYTSQIFATVLKAGYNQYSPQLEAEEIERVRSANFDYQTSVNDYTPFNLKDSSRVKYDLLSGNWVAEDGSRTVRPFGMNQVDEEVLQPVIASLMEENRLERLKVYSEIEDQKRFYLDRWSSEIGNYFRDNRAAADELINRMRETYADYSRAYTMYKSLEDTSGLMKKSSSIADSEVFEKDAQAEMVAGFEAQAQQCNAKQEEFADYMDRIQETITDTTDQFAHIEYYEGSLRDSVSHETAVAMANVQNLDDRRKQLAGISPYLANFAELPPEPRTFDEMYDDVNIDLKEAARRKISEIESGDVQPEYPGADYQEDNPYTAGQDTGYRESGENYYGEQGEKYYGNTGENYYGNSDENFSGGNPGNAQ